jgi:tetratricopeptide (TPR) repeat protein
LRAARISFADYHRRFEAAPVEYLDAEKDAPAEYHNKLTAAKAFALAIDEAAKLHSAAEPLIVHAAILAPEPIPLFLFSEGREKFGEPLASLLAGDGLDEAVAALRAFALVDRETIPDERNPAIETATIRLHRLVRAVAVARRQDEAVEAARRSLIEVMAAAYPSSVWNDPSAWSRARRLDALALDLAGDAEPQSTGAAGSVGLLLERLATYRRVVLAAYSDARSLSERALSIREMVFGPEHPDTSRSLDGLARVLQAQGELASARRLYERALKIREKAFGPENDATATSLNQLAGLLEHQGDVAGARPLYERALAINEKALGPEHPYTATGLNNLAVLLRAQGDLAGARLLHERALAIREKALGPEHPDTAGSLNNLAVLLQVQGDLAGARPLYERALAIREKVLGPEHPDTNSSRNNLARLRLVEGDPHSALVMSEAALAAYEKALGVNHPWTKFAAEVSADALDTLGRADEARALRTKYGIGNGTAG